jgi:hypothetical protein
MREATKKRKFADKLSVENLIRAYEDATGIQFGDVPAEEDQYEKRMDICLSILSDKGAITAKVSTKHLSNHLCHFLKRPV